METHLAFLAADLERSGMSPAEARAEARRRFGGVTQIRERYRDQGRVALVDSLRQDVAYALRQWKKSPLLANIALRTDTPTDTPAPVLRKALA